MFDHGNLEPYGIAQLFIHTPLYNFIVSRLNDSELQGQGEAGRTRQMPRLMIVSREAKKKQAVHDE